MTAPTFPRPAFSDDEMTLLGEMLHHDRTHVVARGHEWDVADIRAVVALWGHLRQVPDVIDLTDAALTGGAR